MSIDEGQVRDAWDRNASLWAERVRSGVDLYRTVFNDPSFLAELPDLVGCEVIDLGCGEGATTRLIARRGARVTGIDLSSRMIELARGEEAREPLGIDYRVASYGACTLFPSERFDGAVSTMALMDSADFSAAAREAFRLLKPGSLFAFSVLHPCFVTPGIRWLKNEQDEESELVVSRYFDEDPFVESRRFAKDAAAGRAQHFDIPRFPRRLETYVNGLVEAGFVIERIVEPRPTAEMVVAHPWLGRWREHAAIFLYVFARKPAGGRHRGD
ncbi:class I SAM-dependent methyltransferase [Trinickia sp.]|uniref:class I SAM-dependent methyltransferase n=1 Tax=Trinickia sp. TaxID=2571163 RepID=UPI003F7DFBEF